MCVGFLSGGVDSCQVCGLTGERQSWRGRDLERLKLGKGWTRERKCHAEGRVGQEKGRAGDGEKGALTRLELGIGGAGESLVSRSQGEVKLSREASLAEAATKSLGKGLMHWILFCVG